MNSLTIKNKTYALPIYLPDATRGITKGVDSFDLQKSKTRGVVVNTYHLMTSPGTEVLRTFGGIKNFMNFDGLVVSDSGGWQVFSLIHRSKSGGKITDEGVTFKIGGGKKDIFTPQESIRMQFEIGSDIMICLDDFTDPAANKYQITESVDRTIKWAKMCKAEFEEQVKKRKLTDETRPHLYAVVQGGFSKEERKRCADALIALDFDGYGYGGYAVGDDGKLDLDLSEYVASLIPDHKPKFALGSGRPEDLVNLSKMGWDIFDCTLPTRDARHKRLYSFIEDNKTEYEYLYIAKEKYANDQGRICEFCDCIVCQQYSRAYLRHLFKIHDTLAYRLATIHNLRFYSRLVELL